MFNLADVVNADARITAEMLPDDGEIPNNPQLPILIYQGGLLFGRADPASICERVFATNRWGNGWRNGIYTFHHFHSTAHEVLAIARGETTVRLGGEAGITLTVSAGDVLVLPAGAGHKNLGQSSDMLVIGAYPPGQTWDLCYGHADERPHVLHNIAAVPLPPSDPIYGVDGPLMEQWQV